MWTHIDSFLILLASTLKLDRESLGLQATLQSGGPTVGPGSNSASGNIIEKVSVFSAGDASKLPSLWYDTIKTNHVDFQVIRSQGAGKVKIPQMIYGWQHHVFPGNCRMCINRWVRVGDGVKNWNDELSLAGLRLRAAFAKYQASTELLVVSTGASFKGVEPYSQYKPVYTGFGRSMHVLELDNFLGA